MIIGMVSVSSIIHFLAEFLQTKVKTFTSTLMLEALESHWH
jgi:hypothetical protein